MATAQKAPPKCQSSDPTNTWRNGNENVTISKTIAVHVRYKFLYISLSSYAKPVKWPNSALSGEREGQQRIFRISDSGTERIRSIFSRGKF